MVSEIKVDGTLKVMDIGGSYYIYFYPAPYNENNKYQFGKFASAPEEIEKLFEEG